MAASVYGVVEVVGVGVQRRWCCSEASPRFSTHVIGLSSRICGALYGHDEHWFPCPPRCTPLLYGAAREWLTATITTGALRSGRGWRSFHIWKITFLTVWSRQWFLFPRSRHSSSISSCLQTGNHHSGGSAISGPCYSQILNFVSSMSLSHSLSPFYNSCHVIAINRLYCINWLTSEPAFGFTGKRGV
jgi:hypothetical protein